jgi:hypothetical protein
VFIEEWCFEMRIIGLLIDLVYKSLFLRGEGGYRSVCLPLKILFVVVSIYYFLVSGMYGSIILIIIVSILGLLDYGYKWIISAYTLSSIPGVWYALTAYILGLLNPSLMPNIWGLLSIYFRTTCFSYLLLFILAITSPTRLANIIYRLGFGKTASAPLLLWRMMPYGLKAMQESLAIGELKGEPVSKRLAPAIASLIEYSKYVGEANYYRLRSPMRISIPLFTDKKYSVILLITSLIISLLIITSYL